MARSGLRPFRITTKFKIGRFTGNQAFSTWTLNQNRKMLKEARKRMYKAAGYCRTSMRRKMGRSGRAVQDYKGYNWKSYRPSPAGRSPRKRQKGRGGLQFVTFDKVNGNDYKFMIGSDMYPAGGYGENTKFHGDVMHNNGGTGSVYLNVQPEDIPPTLRAQAFAGTIPWPMTWKQCNYPSRNYLEHARKATIKQFPTLFANLNTGNTASASKP